MCVNSGKENSINTLYIDEKSHDDIVKRLIDNDYDYIIIRNKNIIKSYNKVNEETLNKNYMLDKLSNREIEVLKLMSDGLSNKEISDKLDISYSTVKNHIYNIFKKLEISGRAQVIRWYIQ